MIPNKQNLDVPISDTGELGVDAESQYLSNYIDKAEMQRSGLH